MKTRFSEYKWPLPLITRVYDSKPAMAALGVVYMSSNFWLLALGSRDLSQADKETTACKAEQIHNMTNIFTQNDNLALCE